MVVARREGRAAGRACGAIPGHEVTGLLEGAPALYVVECGGRDFGRGDKLLWRDARAWRNGRRAGLRSPWRDPWGFESLRPHHTQPHTACGLAMTTLLACGPHPQPPAVYTGRRSDSASIPLTIRYRNQSEISPHAIHPGTTSSSQRGEVTRYKAPATRTDFSRQE